MVRKNDIQAGGGSASSAAGAAGTRKRLRSIYRILERGHGQVPWEWYADHPWYSKLKVLVSAVLLQHESWAPARRVTEKVVRRGLAGILALAADDLQQMLKESGPAAQKAATLRALAETAQAGGGLKAFLSLPREDLRAALLGVKGIGPETAAAIMLYAAHLPVFVVDDYAHRLFRRLGLGPDVVDGLDWRKNYDAWQAYFADGLGEDVELFQRFHAHIVRHCQPSGDDHNAGPCLAVSPTCEGCPLLHRCPSGLRRKPSLAVELHQSANGSDAVRAVVTEVRRETIRELALAGRSHTEIGRAVHLGAHQVGQQLRRLLPFAENDVVRADCTHAMRWMASDTFDAVVTDPPYAAGVARWDEFAKGGFARFTRSWMREAYRVLRPGAYLAAFCSASRWSDVRSAGTGAGFESCRELGWERPRGLPTGPDMARQLDELRGNERPVLGVRALRPYTKRQGGATGEVRVVERLGASDESKFLEGVRLNNASSFEYIVVLRKPWRADGTPPWNASLADDRTAFSAARPDDIEKTCAGAVPAGREHETVKPVTLMDWLVRMVTPPGASLLLDPFCGVGSTLIAAQAAGHRYIGIEKDPLYAYVARERLRHWCPQYDRAARQSTQGAAA
jgi:endonuclease-3 related protein